MNLVNLKTCAEHFNTTTITIKQWIKKGWLKRIEINGKKLYDIDSYNMKPIISNINI